MIKRNDIATVLLGVVVALTLWITILSRETLIGTPKIYQFLHSLPSFLKEIQRGRIGNSFGNIILFVPFGVLFPAVTDWKKMWRTVVAGVGFSLIIETIQLITSRGCFDFDDVLLNCLGTVIGFGLYNTAWKLFTKNDLNASAN
ncbi:MAG: VanZ family protein [Prevotella sp.]|nr:VanZ family protein [Prevotella sp.]